MLGVGWTEMLVIGVVALIVIGPKDLPIVMARLGKVVGQIRRMGNEFQREISKTTGLDEIRNLRTSITEPLRKTTEDIRREFNTLTSTGSVQPSGVLKPADPKVESVVDEIKAAAGMAPAPMMMPLEKPAVVNKPARKAPAKAKAVPASTVIAADIAPVEVVAAPKPKRVAKPKVEVVVAEPVVIAAKKPAARKVAAKPATSAIVDVNPARKRAAKKPVGEA